MQRVVVGEPLHGAHHERADHFAHTEVYGLAAEDQAEPALLSILSPVPKRARPVFAGIWDKEF